MRKLSLLLAFGLFVLSCQKTALEENAIEVDLFYRLSMIDLAGNSTYSKIITTKATVFPSEMRGETNSTNTDDEHWDGDGCDETRPDFCKKHSKHKKCLLLGEKLDFFELQKIDKGVLVSWRSLDESSIIKYSLERSTDAKNFKSIFTQLPKGILNKYSYKDLSKK